MSNEKENPEKGNLENVNPEELRPDELRPENLKPEDIKSMVQARVAEEEASAPQGKNTTEKNSPEKNSNDEKLSLSFVEQCLHHNRIGDATLYVALNQGKFIYVKLWGRWLFWGGQHWLEDIDNLMALTAVNSVCDEYQRLALSYEADANVDMLKFVRKRLSILRDIPGREKLLACTLILQENPMHIEGNEIDKQEYLLSTSNGVVDLRTGKLSQGKPEQYILNFCPTEWKDIDEPSPTFLKFLNSSFDDDEEMVTYMLRLLGYGLLGSRDEHVWAIFHGPRGRNGKDTLMKVIQKVIGSKLAIKIPTAMLLQQSFQRSSSQPEPDIMALRGAKFAFASEGESNQRIAMGKLKDLTGGSIITARGLLDKLMTSWDQTHLLFFLTNELPKMKSDDDAFWTRLHAIHWPIRFVDNPQAPDERPRDPKMFSKLIDESSGILARLVEGCMDYLENGLSPPQKVLSYTTEQREQFDDIGGFIKDCCDISIDDDADKKNSIAVSEFVSILNWWSKQTLGNIYPFSAKRVTQTLEKRGVHSKKSSIMRYVGIAIKPEVLEEYEEFTNERERR